MVATATAVLPFMRRAPQDDPSSGSSGAGMPGALGAALLRLPQDRCHRPAPPKIEFVRGKAGSRAGLARVAVGTLGAVRSIGPDFASSGSTVRRGRGHGISIWTWPCLHSGGQSGPFGRTGS